MPEPNEFQIVKAIQTTLAAISVAGGYFFDIAGAAVKLDPNQGVEALAAPDGLRPFIVIEVPPDSWAFHPALGAEITMQVRLHWFSDTDATSDDAKMETMYRGWSDMETALMRAASTHTIPQSTAIASRGMRAESAASSRLWSTMDLSILVKRRFGFPLGN